MSIPIDQVLVARLIAEQFPEWAELPIEPVQPQGWDNRTFRLGADMKVRLPSAQPYAAQAEKEWHCLPKLSLFLPLAVPTPIALGRPAFEYPWNWSVCLWLEGDTLDVDSMTSLNEIAATLADFLVALQQIPPERGPVPGEHNFYRGAPLMVYDAETREALDVLRGDIPHDAAIAIWERAIATQWQHRPVWIHGDVSRSNLLVTGELLGAVIDFGNCGLGDPACDLTIAWTLFSGESREIFRAGVSLDQDTWDRARGWALWKALVTLGKYRRSDSVDVADARSTLDELFADDIRHHARA